MPALVAAATSRRNSSSGCGPRCWVPRSARGLLHTASCCSLRALPAATLEGTYSVLLDWEREASAAGYDNPA